MSFHPPCLSRKFYVITHFFTVENQIMFLYKIIFKKLKQEHKKSDRWAMQITVY